MTKKEETTEPKQYIIQENLVLVYKALMQELAKAKQQLLSASELIGISNTLASLKEYKEPVAEKKDKKQKKGK